MYIYTFMYIYIYIHIYRNTMKYPIHSVFAEASQRFRRMSCPSTKALPQLAPVFQIPALPGYLPIMYVWYVKLFMHDVAVKKKHVSEKLGQKIECLFLRWDRQKTSSVDDLCILFHYLLMLLSDSCSWVITMHFLEFCGCFFLTWSLVRQFWWLRIPGWSWDPWDDETWIWPPSHMDPPAHPTMRTSSCLSKTKHSTWFAAAKDLLKKKWGQKLNENKICIWGILI